MKEAVVVETAWEVCWQLGGIYTVLRSKVPAMTARLQDHYCMIGPFNKEAASVEFEVTLEDTPFHRAAAKLGTTGVQIHCGRWLVSGRPIVVLIDYLSMWHKIADYKYFFWKDHQIDAGDEQEVNDVILFGYLVSKYLEILKAEIDEQPEAERLPIVAHFHEWMGAAAIPILKHRSVKIATVFTTHATLLGRYLAADDPFFYGRLPSIDAYKAAGERGIYNRFAIERAAAHGADCLTTVSDITAREAEHLLGRKPDQILPNALNIRRFSATHEFQNLHQRYKQMIHEFVMGHFFPSYTFDLNHTLYLFTSGRYEYRNKGMDLFIEALARLNYRLKVAKSQITVVAFIITKAPVKAINVDVLKSQMMFRDLKHTSEEIGEQMTERLIYSASVGKTPALEDLLDQTDQMKLKRLHHAWRSNRLPPICTHDMIYDSDDAVLSQLRTCQLFNSEEDPVKIVYHPEFLTATSPLLGLDYDQFVRGAHLGVFPSYYEPWGYTPMECAALAIPSITSDLSGFGSYIERQLPEHADKGLFVVRRFERSFDESANQLVDLIQQFTNLSQRERIQIRNKVESTSDSFDWNVLVENYWQAHQCALQKIETKKPHEASLSETNLINETGKTKEFKEAKHQTLAHNEMLATDSRAGI